jgi:hypothetical protein
MLVAITARISDLSQRCPMLPYFIATIVLFLTCALFAGLAWKERRLRTIYIEEHQAHVTMLEDERDVLSEQVSYLRDGLMEVLRECADDRVVMRRPWPSPPEQVIGVAHSALGRAFPEGRITTGLGRRLVLVR